LQAERLRDPKLRKTYYQSVMEKLVNS